MMSTSQCGLDHLAVADLASPVLGHVFKREVASWVFVLEDLRGEAGERQGQHMLQCRSLRTVAVDFTGQPGCLKPCSKPCCISLRHSG